MGQAEDIINHMAMLEEQKRNLELENSKINRQNAGIVSIFSGAENSNLIQYQLDLSEEKEKIDHLLRGHVIKKHENGSEFWDEPNDPTMKSLTNYGVEKLMNIINFYLSRNIILSNYSEEVINEKMKDIGWEISDTIFMEYEFIFYRPTYLDLLRRDEEKIKQILSDYSNNPELARTLIKKLTDNYTDEVDKIYRKNCKQYPMIVRLLVDSIHSAYLRALGGEERASLRKVMSVNQTQSDPYNSSYPIIQKPRRSSWNPLNLIRG